jgi:hypothetical protein
LSGSRIQGPRLCRGIVTLAFILLLTLYSLRLLRRGVGIKT